MNKSMTIGSVFALGLLGATAASAAEPIEGFYIGAAAQQWASDGCPDNDRAPLVESALGSLEGALGDWGSLRH